MKVMEPLREEHRMLLPHVEALGAAADAAGVQSAGDLRATLDAQIHFLRGEILPHAHAEDVALYPLVEEVMEAPGATATMRRDHVEVAQLADELVAIRAELDEREPDPSDRQRLQRLLYGLRAILRLHLAKEEEVYLPLLEGHLSPARAARVFELMEQAAAAPFARDVEMVELPDQPVALVRGHADEAQLPGLLGAAYDEVAYELAAQHVEVAGPPFARFRRSQGGFDVEAGFPAGAPVEASGRVHGDLLPGGPAVRVLHRGSYHEVAGAYEVAERWLSDHGWEASGEAWESYLDGPDVTSPRTLVHVPCRRSD